jgi:K+-transporting ATPase KdpF subunit
MPTPAIGCEEAGMLIDYIAGGAVTLGLLSYLVFALLRPERF